MEKIARHVTHRDGSREGTPDPEGTSTPMKEAQRDLTSLSGPVRREADKDEPEA